jgi:hypothetical protein
VNSSGALWKISTENSVGDSLCNWHDKQCSQFIDEINPSVNPLVKMTCHHFFWLCFNFFSHCNSFGIYRENISIGKIPQKVTDRNILSVFLFVFINFLVVKIIIKNSKDGFKVFLVVLLYLFLDSFRGSLIILKINNY